MAVFPVFLFALGAVLLGLTRRKESLLLGFFFQWLGLAAELFARGGGYSVIITLFLGLFLSLASFVFQDVEASRQARKISLRSFAFVALSLLLTGCLAWSVGRPFFLAESSVPVIAEAIPPSTILASGGLLLDRYSLNLILFGLMLYVSCVASMGLRDVYLKGKESHGHRKS